MKLFLKIFAALLLAAGGALGAVYLSDLDTQEQLSRLLQGERTAPSLSEAPAPQGLANALRDMAGRVESRLPQAADAVREVVTPAPLRSDPAGQGAELSVTGVIGDTNRRRAEAGLAPLTANERLSEAARAKVADMFRNQYFEHVAPDGTDVEQLVTAAGYAYIAVGENLALGNYENDVALVQAWMDSPGHRANILNGRFTEIGVAVGKGMFDGQEVWLAVQEFGKPRSDCPEPDAALNQELTANNAQLDSWQAELERQKADIEATSKLSASYNGKVRRYNELVERYNALLEATKALVAEYNAQVQAFNACARQ